DGRHGDRRAWRRHREAVVDVRAVRAGRARADARRQARVRSARPAESGQGHSFAGPLRRVREDARQARAAAFPRAAPLLPPGFGPGSTVGGMIGAGLSGPSRAAVGSVRDHVLGATILNGRGEVLSFGGQVIKNVAGYDVSRLMAGAMGTLGVVLEVSLKVL